jgi:hypothetical protein
MVRDALTQATLDGLGCDNPGCDNDHSVLYLSPDCHPQAGLQLAYSKAHGQLACCCGACNTLIAMFAIAPDNRRGTA